MRASNNFMILKGNHRLNLQYFQEVFSLIIILLPTKKVLMIILEQGFIETRGRILSIILYINMHANQIDIHMETNLFVDN